MAEDGRKTAFTDDEIRAASKSVDQDHITRARGEIPWVDTIDQLTPAEQQAFLLSQRVQEWRAQTPSPTERLSQIVAKNREQTQEKDHSHGR